MSLAGFTSPLTTQAEPRMSRSLPSNPVSGFDRRTFLASLASTSFFAIGCGVDTYEYRLKQTKEYFEYLEKVNLALGSKVVPFDGVELRVPKPFEQILLAFGFLGLPSSGLLLYKARKSFMRGMNRYGLPDSPGRSFLLATLTITAVTLTTGAFAIVLTVF